MAKSKKLSAESWEDALAQHLAGGTGASAKLGIISLGAVRDAIGPDDWPRMEAKVTTAVETVIGKLLDPSDTVIRTGDETYMVLVRSADFETASAKIAEGCDALAKLFFGKQMDVALGFEAEVTEVLAPGSTKKPRTHKVVGDGSRKPGSRKHVSSAGRGKKSRKADKKPKPDIDQAFDVFSFLPVWDARHEVLSTYCVGIWEGKNPSSQHELHTQFRMDDTDARMVAYDTAALKAGVMALEKLEKRGRSALIIAPLSHTTLQSVSGRAAYAEAARLIPKRLRKFMGIRLLDIPIDKSPHVLEDQLATLKGFFGNIVLILEGWDVTRKALAATNGVTSVTLSLPEKPRLRATALGQLGEFVQHVNMSKRAANVHGVSTKNELKTAVKEGTFYVTGPAVGPVTQKLKPAFECPHDSLPLKSAKAKSARRRPQKVPASKVG
ncbi:hypothetical protein [Candidatus Phaeomarinobacter ectocarpi]|nr:hypothetical protein [Candidatus Phaeomarinobacter ectocarpi]